MIGGFSPLEDDDATVLEVDLRLIYRVEALRLM